MMKMNKKTKKNIMSFFLETDSGIEFHFLFFVKMESDLKSESVQAFSSESRCQGVFQKIVMKVIEITVGLIRFSIIISEDDFRTHFL